MELKKAEPTRETALSVTFWIGGQEYAEMVVRIQESSLTGQAETAADYVRRVNEVLTRTAQTVTDLTKEQIGHLPLTGRVFGG